jgi:hypothetical protein
MPTPHIQFLICWLIVACSVQVHYAYIQDFRRESGRTPTLPFVSSLISTIASFSLIVYFWISAAWFWAILVFVVGLLAGLALGIGYTLIGRGLALLLAMAAWPPAAVGAFFAIKAIRTDG